MSAALAAAILRNRPAIGARLTYTVHYRTGGKSETAVHRATVTGYGADCVVIELDDDGGTIRTPWPEWWVDGSCKEVRDGT